MTPLTEFYKAVEDDPGTGAIHISLYMALLQQWNINGGINPVLMCRPAIMKAAKINARHTSNKCMKGLHEYRYIIYEPSLNPLDSSKAYLNRMNKSPENDSLKR